jgi:hypothetical protein
LDLRLRAEVLRLGRVKIHYTSRLSIGRQHVLISGILAAVIGYFETPVGVGAIFLTQLNYAIAPPLPLLSRL